jgi:hypothetical protein
VHPLSNTCIHGEPAARTEPAYGGFDRHYSFGTSTHTGISPVTIPNSMNGQFVRLTPAPEMELHDGKPFAQFDPKTVYLVEGADPIVLGRASSRDTKRINDPDNGYLKVPTGQTALGREHALLCVRNNTVSDVQFGSRSWNHARHSCILQ